LKDRFGRLLKAITILLFFILVAFVFAREINCFDIWLHLGSGRYILQNLKIPTHDIFSYTVAGRAWIDHEWLFQVIVYFLYNIFGANGMVALRMLAFLSVFALLFRIEYKRNNYLTVIAGLLPVLFVASTRNLVRPEIFTLFFVSLFLFILHKYRSGRLVYLLIPAQLLWANIHGYFLAGIIITLIYIISEAINKFINSASGTQRRKLLSEAALRRLILVCLLLILVSFITPYTYKGVLYSIRTPIEFSRHSDFLTNTISELRRPLEFGFNEPVVFWYRILTMVSAVLVLLNIKRLPIPVTILYIIFFSVSATSNRNIALFGIIAGIAMLASLNNIWGSLAAAKAVQRLSRHRRLIEIIACALLIIFISRLIYKRASSDYYVEGARFKSINFGVHPFRHSKGLVEFATEHELEGNVFNNFETGAYIIGNLFPRFRVFIDGRTELYGVDFLARYRSIGSHDIPLEEAIDGYDVDYALIGDLPFFKGFLKKLHISEDWELVYFDGIAALYARNNEKNRRLIRDCAVKLPVARANIPDAAIEELRDRGAVSFLHLARSRFYDAIGESELAIGEISDALKITPGNAAYYHALGYFYCNSKSYHKAIEICSEGIENSGEDLNLRDCLGFAYTRLEQLDRAIEEYEKALKISPKDSSLQGKLRSARDARERREEILAGLKEGLRDTTDASRRAGLYHKAGKELYGADCLVSAIEQLEKALGLDPGLRGDKELSNMLALSFYQAGARSEAVRTLKKALRIGSKDGLSLRNLGYLYFEEGNFDKARSLWQEALSADPGCEITKKYLRML